MAQKAVFVQTLIRNHRMNTRQLSSQIGVSLPTIQRIIAALRQRGYQIRAIRDEHGWSYELTKDAPACEN